MLIRLSIGPAEENRRNKSGEAVGVILGSILPIQPACYRAVIRIEPGLVSPRLSACGCAGGSLALFVCVLRYLSHCAGPCASLTAPVSTDDSEPDLARSRAADRGPTSFTRAEGSACARPRSPHPTVWEDPHQRDNLARSAAAKRYRLWRRQPSYSISIWLSLAGACPPIRAPHTCHQTVPGSTAQLTAPPAPPHSAPRRALSDH